MIPILTVDQNKIKVKTDRQADKGKATGDVKEGETTEIAQGKGSVGGEISSPTSGLFCNNRTMGSVSESTHIATERSEINVVQKLICHFST